MKIFTDTGAWIALADKNDQYHVSAGDETSAALAIGGSDH